MHKVGVARGRSSTEFQNFAEIPIRFTEDGEKISPPIQWSVACLKGTQSLILVIEDADSPTPAPSGARHRLESES